MSGGWSLIRFCHETLSNKIVELGAVVLISFQPCHRLGAYLLNHPLRLLTEVGRVFLCQLNRGYSQTSDICFVGILIVHNHLGRHSIKSADHCALELASVGLLRGHPEVRQLDLPITSQQHVATLDIPVYHFILVQVLQAFQHEMEYV